jgi:hypothetical protein
MIRQTKSTFVFSRTLFLALLILSIFNLVTPLWAFTIFPGIRVHQEITDVALYNGAANPLKATLSDGSSLTFSSRALVNDIRLWNIRTDRNQDDNKLHFDNESLDLGSIYLFSQKKAIVEMLNSANLDEKKAVEARRLLGTSIHTVQDYYSHTTWVENHPSSGIDTRLGRVGPGNAIPVPSGATATCEEDLSKFITDSNVVTSGYYSNFLACPDVEKPGQKCAHGTIFGCDGINKDHGGRPGFSSARSLAIAATKDYVQQVLQQISGNDEAIKMFMVGEEDAFFIDQGSFITSINRDRLFPPDPIDKTYLVEHNLEHATVAFSVSSTANWVSVTPSGGTLSEGDEVGREIIATINENALDLPAGNYSATVKFNGAGTIMDFPVKLEVTEDPGGPIPGPVE